MTRMITVMVLPPGGAALRTEKIDGDNHEEINRLVEGNLGSCSLPHALRQQDFYAFCDDDGMVRQDAPALNRFAEHLGHFALRGPVVIVRTDYSGETLGLRPKDVAALEMYFIQQPSAEALRAAERERQFWRDHPTGMAIFDTQTGAWQDV